MYLFCSPDYAFYLRFSVDQKVTVSNTLKTFHATGLFLYYLKISENLSNSVFIGHWKRPVPSNGLMISIITTTDAWVGKTLLREKKKKKGMKNLVSFL